VRQPVDGEEGDPLPTEVLQAIDRCCDRFEEKLKKGEAPVVEEFVAEFAPEHRSRAIDELLELVADYSAGRAAAPEEHPPSTLGVYRLGEEIGRGGMGVVYRAVHLVMKRTVAVKVLAASLAADRNVRKRFRREAEAAARLHHPNIVAAYDAGEADGRAFLVTELVEGENLAAIVKRDGPAPIKTAIDCCRQAAAGLAYAHARGVIHRDVKPSNLLRDRTGTVKVLDVGLARLDRRAQVPAISADLASGSDATVEGMVMGTIEFMAPEQAIDPAAAGEPADIYSLGCTLYYLLTGKPPFTRENPWDVVLAHRNEPPPDVCAARPEAPFELAAFVKQLLAKTPEDRPANMEEVVGRLAAISPTDPKPPDEAKSRRWIVAGAGAALLALAIGAGLAAKAWWPKLVEAPRRGDASPRPPLAEAPFDGRQQQAAWAEAILLPATWTDAVGIRFKLIPPGKMKIGAREVTIDRPFYLSATEITVGQLEPFARERQTRAERLEIQGWSLSNGAWTPRPGANFRDQGPDQPITPDHPAGNLDPVDGEAFCEWLGRKSKAAGNERRYRIPTATEWQYACRAGSETAWSSGPDPKMLDAIAWYARTAPDNSFRPTGGLQANAFGLHDMHGNLIEIVRADAAGGAEDYRLAGGNILSHPPALAADFFRTVKELNPAGCLRILCEAPPD